MGLFRCPKCDAICHTDEEVCHLCGYRLKPAAENKVEEKPKEETKQDSNVSQKFEISSGFSRKSLFNSVSFDKKKEEEKPKEDPFADLRKKEEKPKEDIFEAYFNQALENNGAIKEEPKVEETKVEEVKAEEPVKQEPVPEVKVEVKQVEVEVVKTDAVFSMPVEEPKEEPIKVEEPKKVEEVKVEPAKVETQKVEEKKQIVEEKPKVVEQPKVEPKPQPTTNPYINNGYKTNSSTSSTGATINPALAGNKKKEPGWVYGWKERVRKNKSTSRTWAIILCLLFILFLILVSCDKREITQHSYYGGTTYTTESKPVWIFFCVVTAIGFVIALIMAIMYASSTLYVKEVDGFYIAVYGYSSDYRLILENRIVDRHYGGRYNTNQTIKLTGKLPNKKVAVATIYYQSYDRIIKIEVLEDTKKK